MTETTRPTLRIRLRYFAAMREARGLEEETRDTTARNPRELYQELRGCGFVHMDEEYIRPARNHAFCNWDEPLADNDIVVFLSPFSGG
jgi:molybdopterin converting factor small subunit